MTAKEAWQRGWIIIQRHPWIALIPLLFDLLRIGLAHAGLPVLPPGESPEQPLRNGHWPPPPTFWLRLPSLLPSIGDLGIPLQPGALSSPEHMAPLLAAGVGVAITLAAVMALYLALLGEKVQGRIIAWAPLLRRALAAVPALFLLLFALRLGQTYLSGGWLLLLKVGAFLLMPAPVMIAAAGERPLEALRRAPDLILDRLDRWLGLSWRVLPLMAAITFLGQIPNWLGLMLFGFVGTAVIGAVTAICLAPEAEMDPEKGGGWLLVLPAAATLAAVMAGTLHSWSFWAPTREAALYRHQHYLHSMPEPAGELVYYAEWGERLGVVRLQRSQIGWRLTSSGGATWHNQERDGVQVALVHLLPLDGRGREVIGKDAEQYLAAWVRDQRAAYIEVKGHRYPLVDGQEYLLLPAVEPLSPRFSATMPEVGFRVLDAAGNLLREGRLR